MRKGRGQRLKSTRTINKKRFPIGDYKVAMAKVKEHFLSECKSLEIEKQKVDAITAEVKF